VTGNENIRGGTNDVVNCMTQMRGYIRLFEDAEMHLQQLN